MDTPDILGVIEPVVQAFERLGVSYYIGGSVASSALGLFRATLDVDLVTDLKTQHVRLLVSMLKDSYYIDEEMIVEAIRRQASCNLLHLETMHKVDIFILKDTPYDSEAFQRKRKNLLAEGHSTEFYLATPEDIVLNKLDWFRMGGEVSERQWLDVLGVLKVQKEHLDLTYLRKWGRELDLSDLLEQAFQEAGIE